MAPKRKSTRRRRVTRPQNIVFYYFNSITEGTVEYITASKLSNFPAGWPYRPVHLSWTVSLSGSATSTNSSLVHRSALYQVGVYSPIETTADRTIWNSGPKIVPWGNLSRGRTRINVPWYDDESRNRILFHIECMCFDKDTATTTIDVVFKMRVAFRAPDFPSICPTLRTLLRRDNDDDDVSGQFQSLHL